MKKADTIRKYGIETYDKYLEQSRNWQRANPEKVSLLSLEQCRKNGKYYNKKLLYMRTGIQGAKNKVRMLHIRIYSPFKRIIDPNGLTHIHHEYLNDGTANFRGVALVEKDQHQHGIIKPIIILEGKITLMTEKDIREQGNAL